MAVYIILISNHYLCLEMELCNIQYLKRYLNIIFFASEYGISNIEYSV